jgi:2-polyprenyl-3-methyl-5-hydroxy-6-metoxy-1,4-benzoquinol methylase
MNMALEFRNHEAALQSGEQIGFSFGENWQKYAACLDEARIQQARISLQNSFADLELADHRFIDVGCGSGLFSLCARRAGASEVVSFDVDPNSVACARALRQREGRPSNWAILRGSVLDTAFLESIEPASRVYSWGVLHHTGSVWEAIEKAMLLVAPGGLLCLGLYNRPNHVRRSLALKRIYNSLPRPLRPLLSLAYGSALLGAVALVRRESPTKYVSEYGRRSRGMSFWRDVEDWLGGLPCEFVDEHDVREFAEPRQFVVERVLRRGPGANNEYLLRRTGSGS